MEVKTVLFVDDEQKILNSLKRGLADEPYESLFANSGKEALEMLAENDVHVLVTDMGMPEMSGFDLLKIVKEDYPHIIRMVLSGHSDMNTLLAAVNHGEIFRYIAKPWSFDGELKTIVRQAIEFYMLHSERESLMNVIEQVVEGTDLEKINLRFVQMLISERKDHLYEWRKKCDSVPLNSQ